MLCTNPHAKLSKAVADALPTVVDKYEECADGIVYARLLNAIYAGLIGFYAPPLPLDSLPFPLLFAVR